MYFKVILVALLASSVHGSGGYSSFSYGVSDPHTGDVKSQTEKRVGDTVVGQYSLLESDGSKRIVDYSSHPQTGFNAVVRKDAGVHPISTPYAGLNTYAAAARVSYASPVKYLAPVVPPVISAYSSVPAIHSPAVSTYSTAVNTPVVYAYSPIAAVQTPAISAYSTSLAHPTYAGYAYGVYPIYSGHSSYSPYNGYSSYNLGSLYKGYGTGYARLGLEQTW